MLALYRQPCGILKGGKGISHTGQLLAHLCGELAHQLTLPTLPGVTRYLCFSFVRPWAGRFLPWSPALY